MSLRVSGIVLFCSCLHAGTAAQSLPALDAAIAHWMDAGQQDSLLHYSEQKLAFCRKADQLDQWAWTCIEVSDYWGEQAADIDAALHWLDICLTQRWRVPTSASEWEPFCYARGNRGYWLMQRGQFYQATEAYTAAAQLWETYRFDDFEAVQTIYKPLGNCFTRLGDNDKAIAVFQKALDIGADNETLAGLYSNLGKAYWNQSDFNRADRHFHLGLALNGVSTLKRGLLLSALAQSALDQGELSAALQQVRASLSLLRNRDAEERVYRYYALLTAGELYTRMQRFQNASDCLNEAKTLAIEIFGWHSRELAKVEVALARLSLARGEATAALTFANQAMAAVLPGWQPAGLYANPDTTRFYEENAIFEALSIKAAASTQAFEQDKNLGWLELALACHDLAWNAESRLRRTFYYHSSKLQLQKNARDREAAAMSVARRLYDQTGDQRLLEHAFLIAERSKAAWLLEAVQEHLFRSFEDPRLTNLRQAFAYFEKQMLLHPDDPNAGYWRRDADELLVQIRELEKTGLQNHPHRRVAAAITCVEAQALLQPEEGLLAYFAGTDYLECFVLRPANAPVWYRLPYHPKMLEAAAGFLTYFKDENQMLNNPAGYLQAAFQMTEWLAPAAIRTCKHWLVAPDGIVNFMPFDAMLRTAPGPQTHLRNADYLIRSHEIRYAWSASVLRQQQAMPAGANLPSIVFAPGFMQGARGLAPLRFWPEEGPSGAARLEGPQATASRLMEEAVNCRVIHLATHAFADGLQPPRLELYDRALFLPEIYAMRLQAELVTLSACQTALGQQQSGEGVMSLARAFAQAGAACVVSSLWTVNDRSSGQLLAGFYRRLEAGLPISAALRQSKLQYLDDPQVRGAAQSPYHWAGLAMIGDNRVLQPQQVPLVTWVVVMAILIGLFWAWYKRHEKV